MLTVTVARVAYSGSQSIGVVAVVNVHSIYIAIIVSVTRFG